jgi:hypothetical protein
MITIHQFKRKIFLTEADAPPAGAAPPAGGGASPPAGGDMGGLGGGGAAPPSDLGGLGGSLGGATPPSMGADLGGAIGGAATGNAPAVITDIKKLNAWDLLEKYFSDKVKLKDELEPYL